MIKGRKEVVVGGRLKGKIFRLDICFIYFSLAIHYHLTASH